MNKLNLKQLADKYNCIVFDRSDQSDENTKSSLLFQLKKQKAPEVLLDYYNEFWNIAINKNIDNYITQTFSVLCPQKETNHNFSNSIVIGKIECCKSNRLVLFRADNNTFTLDNDLYISSDIDGLFQYIVSEKSILPINIDPNTYAILEKAGWYNGRIIDIEDVIDFYKNNESPLSDMQISFLTEFGNISGCNLKGEFFEILTDPKRYQRFNSLQTPYHRRRTITSPIDMSPINIISVKENVDMLNVGSFDNNEIELYLSTDGRFFTAQGKQLGRNIMEGWQSILL